MPLVHAIGGIGDLQTHQDAEVSLDLGILLIFMMQKFSPPLKNAFTFTLCNNSALVSLLIFSFTTENFFTQRNFTSILRSASYVGLIAFPMTFVLITREIDISVGPSVAWSGLFFVILITFFLGFFGPFISYTFPPQ